MNHIYIDKKGKSNRIALLENKELVEFYKDDNEKSILGNIYRARVVSVLKGMSAAFIDIGAEKNGYLYVKDALNRDQMYTEESYTIDEVLKNNQQILVQVIKEPLGQKGVKLTRHLTIPSRHMVLTPFSNKIHVSKKIDNPKEVKWLKKLGEQIKEDEVGIIFRTLSLDTTEEVIKMEYKNLINVYYSILKEENYLPTPKLLYKEPDYLYGIIRDYYREGQYKIVSNDKNALKEIRDSKYFEHYNFNNALIFDPEFNVDYDMDIQRGIKNGLARRVDLKSGGYIVIDETEALSVIDVNTGSFTGTSSLQDTVVRINIEASYEVAKQMRLRDLGGIIIVDFIDMKETENIEKLLDILANEFKKDKNKPYIVDITKLGLVEIVRKKTRPTLDKQNSILCPTCFGNGRIRKK
ncbi:MAG: Rne/Rng family ribonuclease [Gudongella sp.]|nr:Rne/Rng family ribonuclease [Gudongella sp.]